MLQQPALEFETAAITGQGPIRAHNTMAWHDHSYRICAVREAHGANRRWPANPRGELRIGGGTAAGNRSQRMPHLALKRRAAGRHRQRIKGSEIASEVTADRIAQPMRN